MTNFEIFKYGFFIHDWGLYGKDLLRLYRGHRQPVAFETSKEDGHDERHRNAETICVSRASCKTA